MTEAIDFASAFGRALHQAGIVLVASDPMEALRLTLQFPFPRRFSDDTLSPTVQAGIRHTAFKSLHVGGRNNG